MTEYVDWAQRVMIILAGHAEDARELAATLTGPGGEGLWTTPLNATGEGEPTHFISSGRVDRNFANLLPLVQITWSEAGEPTEDRTEGQPVILATMARQAGMSITDERVAQILSAAHVSNHDPYMVMNLLGLKIITPPMSI